MLAQLRSRARRMLYPPRFDESVPLTVRNTYLLSWVIVMIGVPLLALFAIAEPQLARLIVPMTTVLGLTAAAQILIIRSGRSNPAGPVLAILGWAMLSWVAWETGGLHSPALYGLFVFVVLAEMCNGWRWGMGFLALSTLTVAIFAWAEVTGVPHPNEITVSPVLFAVMVAAILITLAVLAAILTDRMRVMRSELHARLTQREAAELRLLDLVDNAPFGAIMCHETADGLIVTHVNPAASTVLGRQPDEIIGRRVEDTFPAETSADTLRQFHRVARRGGTHDVGAMPYDASGEHRVLDLHAFQGAPGSLAAFFTDVTDRRDAEAEVNRMAFHDDLTELPNRAMLDARLASALASAHERDRHVALLFIDLDNFKPINDEYGHGAGDDLLVAVAQRLRGCARSTDTVARMGGDEFTMIIADIETRDQAELVARKAVAALREPFKIAGNLLYVTASVGVAMTTDQDRTVETLFAHSDVAMYEAKRSGRDGYHLFWNGAA